MCEFLVGSISQTRISALLGFVLSFVVEWWPQWETTVLARTKRLAMMAASLLIGLGVWGLSVVVGCAEASVEGAWTALSAGFAAYLANQVAHLRYMAPTRAARTGPQESRR